MDGFSAIKRLRHTGLLGATREEVGAFRSHLSQSREQHHSDLTLHQARVSR